MKLPPPRQYLLMAGRWPDFATAQQAVTPSRFSGAASKVAFAINLPAVLVAYVIVAALTSVVPESYLYTPVLVAWLVAPFWYLVGRWLDRRLS